MTYDCDCGYDRPEIYRESKPRARKRYACDECRGFIEPGERYHYAFMVYDGAGDSFHTCERCYDIAIWVKNNVPCLCWLHGNLIDECKEAVEAAASRAPLETAGLRFGLLRRIVQRDRLNRSRRAAA